VVPLISPTVTEPGYEPPRSTDPRKFELPPALFARPKSGFQLPIADWLESDSKRSRSSRVGAQSRRLALLVLEAFGVSIPASDASRELDLRENRQHGGQ